MATKNESTNLKRKQCKTGNKLQFFEKALVSKEKPIIRDH